jgi:hypothetical protein
MADTSVNKLLEKRSVLLDNIVSSPGFIRGSLIITSRPGKNNTRRPFRFLSRRVNGTNKSTYVKEGQVAAFEKAVKLYLETAEVIEKICNVNIEIIRKGGSL